ncbi:MAG: HIT family protein [Nitrososphaerales archaeon]
MKIKNSASVAPENCIFCKIIARTLPAAIVYENEEFVAFMDRAPFSTGHTLVCPKKHGETIWDMTEPEIGGLFTLAAKISKAIVKATESDGFRFVQNNGEAANQVVAHVHIHVIPVKMSHKGSYMDRKNPSMEDLEKTANEISSALDTI